LVKNNYLKITLIKKGQHIVKRILTINREKIFLEEKNNKENIEKFCFCDICGNPMVKKINKENKVEFLGCSNFPKCKNTKDISFLKESLLYPNKIIKEKWKIVEKNLNKLDKLTNKTTNLSSLIDQLKDLHNLNGTTDRYDHYREIKTKQLTILALENINAELATIKKQLHTMKHRSTRG